MERAIVFCYADSECVWQSAVSVQGRLTHAQALDTGPGRVTMFVCFDDEYETSYRLYQ